MNTLKTQNLILKYGWLLISRYVVSHLLSYTILYYHPSILNFTEADGSIHIYGSGYLLSIIMYVFNIIISILIYSDMRKSKTISYPLLILGIVNSFSAVILYLITNYDSLKYKTINNE